MSTFTDHNPIHARPDETLDPDDLDDLIDDEGPPAAVTSAVLLDVANELRSGRHPLVTGRVGDRVLLLGDVQTLPDALGQLGRSSFEVVLLVNAVDGVQVLAGEDRYAGTVDDGSPDRDVVDDAPTERERRLEALRARAARDGDGDVIAEVRRALTQCEHRTLVILEQADILLQDPAQHDQPDRERVAALQLALRDAARVGRYRNTAVLIAGQTSGIPSVLLAGSEEIGMVEMAAPGREERVHFLRLAIGSMPGGAELRRRTRRALVDELAALTDGDSLRTLESLVAFAIAGQHSVLQPRRLVDTYRYGIRPDYWGHLRDSLAVARERFEARVFGQAGAIDAVMDALSAAALGLDLTGNRLGSEGQPRGILWFVGPTGVGKTELAKTIAEVLFGDAEAYFRLDMANFAQEHSAERLMGAPPGYVGFELGGELTNAVRRRPNLVILLDEIEKAHPKVIERFMSILEDGRITDAQGRVTFFGETFIIATSNEGSRKLADLLAQEGSDVAYAQVAAVSTAAVRDYFGRLGRPEIFGRIATGVVPFDVLRPAMIDRITAKFAGVASFEHGPELDVDLASFCEMARLELDDPNQRALGGRQVRNVVQQRFRWLASWLAAHGHLDAHTVRVSFDGRTMLAAVDDQPPVPVR